MDRKDYEVKEVLRQNVKACLAMKAGPSTVHALKAEAKIGQATVDRILAGNGAKIEKIEKIAKVYELEIWQLFVPGMNPANPPALMPLSQAEREFHERLREAFEKVATSKEKK